MRKIFVLLGLWLATGAYANTAPESATGFADWLAALRGEAVARGIRQDTVDAALAGVQPVTRAIELDRRQPEFLSTFAGYLGRRVTPRQVARGQALLVEHAALLDAVEARYGVPRTVLVAFWGLETNYGASKGGFNIPAALATLAHDGRRSSFFREQLFDALHILDAGHVQAIDMNGSWAGAMGHMQFMPSTFRAHALDADGDGRIDLWNSLPDALHSAAHYLQRAGWRTATPVAQRVQLPQDFDWREARVSHRLSVAEWRARGVTLPEMPETLDHVRAAVILPQGWQGPAYLVFDNFDVVMQWNRSVNYALSVAELAHRLGGGDVPPLPEGERHAVSTAQIIDLQRALNELGFETGTPDGLIGPRTQSALRRYQVFYHLPADGYPAPSVVAHVAQTYLTAQQRQRSSGLTFSE